MPPVFRRTLKGNKASLEAAIAWGMMVSALGSRSVIIRGWIDQPITSRLNRSITTFRYSQPSAVAM